MLAAELITLVQGIIDYAGNLNVSMNIEKSVDDSCAQDSVGMVIMDTKSSPPRIVLLGGGCEE